MGDDEFENEAENQHILLNGRADMRTLILNFFIILVVVNFALNILILQTNGHHQGAQSATNRGMLGGMAPNKNHLTS